MADTRSKEETLPAGYASTEARIPDEAGDSPAGVSKRRRSGPADTVPGSRRDTTATGEATPITLTCPRCAASIPAHFHFCGSCGFNLGSSEDGLVYRDPLIGVVVGDRYRLLSRIGIGGMGTVYKAEHIHMGKVVAVKLLHGDLSRDVQMIRRFTREARAVSKLSSPYTVTVFDYGQNDGLFFLVMEYLQGQDLGQVLRGQGPLDLRTTSRIVGQVASSLDEAHSHGIVHRDLKPENIFLCSSEDDGIGDLVKVLDFGLAKLRETREDSLVSTAHGNIIGTPYYMSPEQISGHEVDVRSDVYGLGAVTFKLLTGKPPFHHENPVAVLGKHLAEPPPKASTFSRGLESVDAVLIRSLAKKPSARYQTVRDFSAALRRAALDPSGEHSATPSIEIGAVDFEPVSTKRDFDRFERRLKAKRIATVLLASLLVLGAGYTFWWGVIQGNFIRSEIESEPNDDPTEADRLFLGESIRGHIGAAAVGQRADNDFYLIENELGRPVMLSLELTGVPQIDLVMKIYDPEARGLVSANSGEEGEGEAVPNLLFSQRHVFVQVREYWVRNRPPRANLEDAYTLSVTARDPLENEEHEPNERITMALQTRDSESYLGLIGWSGDVDLFRAPELPAGGTMVEVVAETEGTVDLELRAYDIGADELFRWNRAPAGEPERAVFFAAPERGHGALFIGVAAAGDDDFDPEGFYELRISLRPVEGLSGPP